MSYVRTIDGVYEFPKGFTEFKWNKKLLLENKEHVVWAGGEIIDQADTIEELCDEFRGVWTNYFEREKKDAHEEYHYDKKNNVFYNDFEELTHKEAIEKFDIFYGAIWTDKGLIFVAELNKEKGNLKLL